MISGIYFAWNFLMSRWQTVEQEQRLRYPIFLIMTSLITWLLYLANSVTSFVCLVVAICLFTVSRHHSFAQNQRRIFAFGIACVVIYGILELVFDVKGAIISMLGRRPDLTTRVPMWEELLGMAQHPITGFGFESFWLGARRDLMIEHWRVSGQAHNGYLDIYLILGLI